MFNQYCKVTKGLRQKLSCQFQKELSVLKTVLTHKLLMISPFKKSSKVRSKSSFLRTSPYQATSHKRHLKKKSELN